MVGAESVAGVSDSRRALEAQLHCDLTIDEALIALPSYPLNAIA